MLHVCDAIKSLKSKIFVSCFLAFSTRELFKLSLGEIPMEIGQLILENIILNDYKDDKKQRDYLLCFGYIFKLLFLKQNHLALLKDRFLKKMLLKRVNTRRLFFTKL